MSLSFYTSALWLNYIKKYLNALRAQCTKGFRVQLGFPRVYRASSMFTVMQTNDSKRCWVEDRILIAEDEVDL